MDNNNAKLVRLALELPEVNKILEALGQQPYATVYQLIAKIQQQAAEQLNSSNARVSNLSSVVEEQPDCP